MNLKTIIAVLFLALSASSAKSQTISSATYSTNYPAVVITMVSNEVAELKALGLPRITLSIGDMLVSGYPILDLIYNASQYVLATNSASQASISNAINSIYAQISGMATNASTATNWVGSASGSATNQVNQIAQGIFNTNQTYVLKANSTNYLQITNAGSSDANGTYLYSTAGSGSYTNANAMRVVITNVAGTKFIQDSNGVSLYSASDFISSNWSVISGSSPAPTSMIGARVELNGISLLGWLHSTNLSTRLSDLISNYNRTNQLSPFSATISNATISAMSTISTNIAQNILATNLNTLPVVTWWSTNPVPTNYVYFATYFSNYQGRVGSRIGFSSISNAIAAGANNPGMVWCFLEPGSQWSWDMQYPTNLLMTNISWVGALPFKSPYNPTFISTNVSLNGKGMLQLYGANNSFKYLNIIGGSNDFAPKFSAIVTGAAGATTTTNGLDLEGCFIFGDFDGILNADLNGTTLWRVVNNTINGWFDLVTWSTKLTGLATNSRAWIDNNDFVADLTLVTPGKGSATFTALKMRNGFISLGENRWYINPAGTNATLISIDSTTLNAQSYAGQQYFFVNYTNQAQPLEYMQGTATVPIKSYGNYSDITKSLYMVGVDHRGDIGTNALSIPGVMILNTSTNRLFSTNLPAMGTVTATNFVGPAFGLTNIPTLALMVTNATAGQVPTYNGSVVVWSNVPASPVTLPTFVVTNNQSTPVAIPTNNAPTFRTNNLFIPTTSTSAFSQRLTNTWGGRMDWSGQIQANDLGGTGSFFVVSNVTSGDMAVWLYTDSATGLAPNAQTVHLPNINPNDIFQYWAIPSTLSTMSMSNNFGKIK